MTARRILGIDFSGANDAGHKIWIAEGALEGAGFALSDLRPASALPGGAAAPGPAVAALLRHILVAPNTVAGCDFPFSIPRSMIEEPSWAEFIRRFPRRFPDAQAFRNWAMEKTGGRELRRDTDRAASTPFNSYNLRIYRQTWWGIVGLLHPLVVEGTGVVPPYQSVGRGVRPVVIEACPACAMKSIGFYPPYKGREMAHRKARRDVLGRLVRDGLLQRPHRSLAARLLDNVGGDALDAVIAAITTAHADLRRKSDEGEALEGYIYGRFTP